MSPPKLQPENMDTASRSSEGVVRLSMVSHITPEGNSLSLPDFLPIKFAADAPPATTRAPLQSSSHLASQLLSSVTSPSTSATGKFFEDNSPVLKLSTEPGDDGRIDIPNPTLFPKSHAPILDLKQPNGVDVQNEPRTPQNTGLAIALGSRSTSDTSDTIHAAEVSGLSLHPATPPNITSAMLSGPSSTVSDPSRGPLHAQPRQTSSRRGRGARRRSSSIAHGTIEVAPYTSKEAQLPAHKDSFPDKLVGIDFGPSLPQLHAKGRGGRQRGTRGAIRTPTRGRGRGVATRGLKRKRSSLAHEISFDDDDEDENAVESDSSEEIVSLPTQSRSGRQITKVNTAPIIKIDDEDAPPVTQPTSKTIPLTTPPPGNRSGQSSKSASSLTPSHSLSPNNPRKVHFRRTPGASATCQHCQRPHSPSSNAIVFCDSCNRGWHQHCHTPPISSSLLREANSDWFCADCLILSEERARLASMSADSPSARKLSLSRAPPEWSLAEKREYFASLEKSDLVGLLVHIVGLHPNLPVFAHDAVERMKGKAKERHKVFTDDEEEEQEEEDVYEEEALPYPKAGNGVTLPSEAEDVDVLVDIGEYGSVSHRWEGIADIVREAEEKMRARAVGAVVAAVGA